MSRREVKPLTTLPSDGEARLPMRDRATVVDLASEMARFVEQKGWTLPSSKRPQTPRNLAVSLVLEATELLECFQWSEVGDAEQVREEMADVLLYLLQLSNVLGIDLAAAARSKLAMNRERAWDIEEAGARG